MANITKRTSKTGKVSYRIRVYTGETLDGKQKYVTKTWTPPDTMRPSTAEKEANRVATLFEEDIKKKRVSLDGKTRFAVYAEDILSTLDCEPKTMEQYTYLLKRINDEIGHLPLVDITQDHLRHFYKKLRTEGQKQKGATATSMTFKKLRQEKKLTQVETATRSGLSVRTVIQADNGRRVSLESARVLSKIVGKKLHDVFIVDKGSDRLSEATIWHHHKLIRMILGVAHSERKIPYNEASDMKNAPTMPEADIQHLDDEQAQAFVLALNTEPDIRVKTALLLDIYTGLRRGELCGVSWPDVDFVNHTIRINKTSQYQSGAGIVEKSTKNENSKRTIVFQEDLLPILAEYKHWWTEQRLKYGRDWKGKEQRLFIQDDGKPIFPNTIYRWLQAFLRRNGLPQVSLHSLRHTCLTLLLSTGADVKSVQQISGHSTAGTLLDTYGHFLPSTQERHMNALGDILSKKLKKA